MMTEYETTMVIRPDVGGDMVESTLDRVRDAVSHGKGKLLALNHWGKKRLAYEISRHTRGIYVHAHYVGTGAIVSELERNLRISDSVLRYLTVQLERDVDPGALQIQDYVQPEYEAEAAEETPQSDPAELSTKEEAPGEAASEESAAATAFDGVPEATQQEEEKGDE